METLRRRIDGIEKSRQKICNLFRDHLEKLNADKTKITSDLRARIAQSYKLLNNELQTGNGWFFCAFLTLICVFRWKYWIRK